MDGSTMKTLAEYIVGLNNRNKRLENPDEYEHRPLDTNGVEEDHIETFWPPDNNERTGT